MVEQKFFAGKRQKGFQDPTFLSAINEKFIVLVATSLGNALSGWKTGLWVSPPDFKSDICQGIFVRRNSSVP
jgi:hypothetical protein